jgi:tRNA threonylcarbamoyladenosine biosynthesis protein TsaB
MADDRNLSLSILALESAGSACSAALLRDGRIAAQRFAEMEHGQAEALIPMVQAVMTEAGLGYDQIDLVAVGTGPGSYTGVRVALAAARGLASAAGKPLTGVSNFDAVYAAVATHRPALVAIETRRADFYIQLFAADGAAESPPAIVGEAELTGLFKPGETVTVAGDAATRAAPLLHSAGCAVHILDAAHHADAVWVARVAAARWHNEDAPRPAEPIYLRPPDAHTVAERAAMRAEAQAALAAARLTQAAPAHGAVMAALQNACFDEHWSAEAMTILLGQPGVVGTILVAADSEIPLGYGLLRAVAGEAEILTLGIDPRNRRAGLGRRLLADLITRARQTGAETLFLEVGETNRAARALYGAAGFTQVGRRPGYYRGPRGVEDGLTYRRAL